MAVFGALACLTPSVSQLSAVVDLDRRSLGGLWSEAGYRRELESPNSCLRVLQTNRVNPAAADDPAHHLTGAILGIGCAWAIVDEAHITVLGIDPAYQRRGLGQWLLIHLLEDARQRQLKRATLEVRVSNQRAIALYQRFGFVELGQRRRYYSDGEDALILWHNQLETEDFGQKLRQHRDLAAQRLIGQGWALELSDQRH